MAMKPTHSAPERIAAPAEITLDHVRNARAGVPVASIQFPHRAAEALTNEQADGTACVLCGHDFTGGRPSIPVGTLQRGQVFACVDCEHGAAPNEQDDEIMAFAREYLPRIGREHGIRGVKAFMSALTAAIEGRIDEVQARAVAEALNRGDLAAVERTVSG